MVVRDTRTSTQCNYSRVNLIGHCMAPVDILDGSSRGKGYSKCMRNCSIFNRYNSAIVHLIFDKEDGVST